MSVFRYSLARFVCDQSFGTVGRPVREGMVSVGSDYTAPTHLLTRGLLTRWLLACAIGEKLAARSEQTTENQKKD